MPGWLVGLDIEPRLLAVAGQLSAPHDLAVEVVRADAASTGLPSGSFDLVASLGAQTRAS